MCCLKQKLQSMPVWPFLSEPSYAAFVISACQQHLLHAFLEATSRPIGKTALWSNCDVLLHALYTAGAS
jgi:hypothetical protein